MKAKNLTTGVLFFLFLGAMFGCGDDEEPPAAIIDPSLETPVLTAPEIAEIALASTVALRIRKTDGTWLQPSSGFIVGDGQIATAHHVIADMATGISTRVVGEPTTQPIESIIVVDEVHDLAIIKASGIAAPPLSLGDSDTVQVGDTVYVTGNPDGYLGTFSTGVISAIRPGDLFVAEKIFQITAPISSGSSGGPVLNNKGEVIGIVNGDDINGQNLNFAIPVNFLKALLRIIQ